MVTLALIAANEQPEKLPDPEQKQIIDNSITPAAVLDTLAL